jgi:glycosyltransferase involved in cell wall biosynthesis
MEAAVVRWAHRVTLTTEAARRAMALRYPLEPSAKFVSVPNSIDTDRLRVEGQADKYDTFTIAYTGVLYFHRTPEALFKAVADLLASGRASRHDIRIKLIGECQEADGVPTDVLVRRYGLEGMVEISGFVPYSEAVQIMQRSHLLLVLAPEHHRLMVPAKTYDYLGTGSVLLALAEPGAMADFVADTKCGRCFSHSDTEGLSGYLAALLRDDSFRSLRNDPGVFSKFEARNLTQRLTSEMMRAEEEQADARVVIRA